jgi:hypothetical protein
MAFQQSFDAEQAKPYRKRADTGKLRSKAASVARKIIRGRRPITADDVSAFALDGWFTADASIAILIMLSNAPKEGTTIDAFAQVATMLVAWWEADRHDRSNRESHSYETEYALKELLAEGLFRVAETDAAHIVQPLLDSVDTHADKVADILQASSFAGQAPRARFWFMSCSLTRFARGGFRTSTLNMRGTSTPRLGVSRRWRAFADGPFQRCTLFVRASLTSGVQPPPPLPVPRQAVTARSLRPAAPDAQQERSFSPKATAHAHSNPAAPTITKPFELKRRNDARCGLFCSALVETVRLQHFGCRTTSAALNDNPQNQQSPAATG